MLVVIISCILIAISIFTAGTVWLVSKLLKDVKELDTKVDALVKAGLSHQERLLLIHRDGKTIRKLLTDEK
jgi:hypothetical protein